jgi:hypothetical protein
MASTPFVSPIAQPARPEEPSRGRSRYASAPKKGALCMRMGISLGGLLLILLIVWLLFFR